MLLRCCVLVTACHFAAGFILQHRHHRPSRCRHRMTAVDQDKTPILDALSTAAQNIKAPFFFPGHKMGRGLVRGLQGPFSTESLGHARSSVWQYDLPEIPELDNLFSPEGPIKEAEELAASVFGAKKTWFLVNGSTSGVIAAVLAAVRRHQQRRKGCGPSKVLLPRNAHKSAINALILSGADPVFLTPTYDDAWDICHGAPIEGEQGLRAVLECHAPGGDVAAVLLVSPTYHGALSDIRAAVALCRAHGVPLIVDEAHGAHLQFMATDGQEALGALQSGADVVVQSTHKTLTALSQAAMLHAGETLDEEGIELISSALQMVQSSSPNYILLASLDAARWQLGSSRGNGRQLIDSAAEFAARARHDIVQSAALRVLKPPSDGAGGAFVGLDPLRITVHMGNDLSGYEADEVLIGEHGVYAELPASRSMTFVLGPGSCAEDVERLVGALGALKIADTGAEPMLSQCDEASTTGSMSQEASARVKPAKMPGVGKRVCSPREAYMTASEMLATDSDAIVGRASAEIVCPYPPGIPLLLPGEEVTREAIEYLQRIIKDGGTVTGCSDATLGRLRVLARPDTQS